MPWVQAWADSFTNTNGTTLAAHNAAYTSDVAGLTINNNRLRANTSFPFARVTISGLQTDQRASLAYFANNEYFGHGVRYTFIGGGDQRYTAYTVQQVPPVDGGPGLALFRRDTTSWVNLGNVSTSFASGDVVMVEAHGNQISVYNNGTRIVGPVTDSNYPTGTANLRAGQTAADFGDDFLVEHWVIPTFDQSAYRFRADDGSESGASWLASQDAAVARGPNTSTRLRVQVDTAYDTEASRVRLEYRLNGGNWVQVGR